MSVLVFVENIYLPISWRPVWLKKCYHYGDSYLQLKRVRLRTTFASADTSSATVKLSCCEHYGNVLHEYNDQELKAVSWNSLLLLVSQLVR
jgi:hypothetical protein